MHRGQYHHPYGFRRGMGVLPFMLFAAIFVMFLIFKAGLFVPMMLLGALFWMFAHHRRGSNGDFGPGFKHDSRRDFRTYDYKQKHDDEIEYI